MGAEAGRAPGGCMGAEEALGIGSGAGGAILGAASIAHNAASATHGKFRSYTEQASSASTNPPLSSLARAYAAYTMCSVPSLVEYSPHILRTLLSVPVVKQITEVSVRAAFFNKFVAGKTARDTIPVLRALRTENKGALLVYTLVEVGRLEPDAFGQGNASHKRSVDEMIKTVDTAADFEDSLDNRGNLNRRTWIALKLSALIPDARALIKLSAHIVKARLSQGAQIVPFPGSPAPSDLAVLDSTHTPVIFSSCDDQMPSASEQSMNLTQKDVESLRKLHADLEEICTRAKGRDVKVVIDAEYSWYQPAVDAFQSSLMRKFNALDHNSGDIQPLVYGTWQAYLRRNPGFLAEALRDARKHNYALGVKLVRGASHEYEIHAHHAQATESKEDTISISPDPDPPVWTTKFETDTCFNEGVRTLVRAVAADVNAASDGSGTSNNSWWPLLSSSRESSETELSVPQIAVIFGTHNQESCEVVLEELVKANLASKEEIHEEGNKRMVVSIQDEVVQRVAIAQLYGMYDDLTDSLVQRTKSNIPFVMKYLPYGVLSKALPYLVQCAVENKLVLGRGGAEEERKRIWRLIRAKLVGRCQ
ncbi:FAD-linked oxidoreductase [Amanita rubescens]|nr:FAD-linked oxidoreductase [Amanita rubescens]